MQQQFDFRLMSAAVQFVCVVIMLQGSETSDMQSIDFFLPPIGDACFWRKPYTGMHVQCVAASTSRLAIVL